MNSYHIILIPIMLRMRKMGLFMFEHSMKISEYEINRLGVPCKEDRIIKKEQQCN